MKNPPKPHLRVTPFLHPSLPGDAAFPCLDALPTARHKSVVDQREGVTVSSFRYQSQLWLIAGGEFTWIGQRRDSAGRICREDFDFFGNIIGSSISSSGDYETCSRRTLHLYKTSTELLPNFNRTDLTWKGEGWRGREWTMISLEVVEKKKKDGDLGEVRPNSSAHPKYEAELVHSWNGKISVRLCWLTQCAIV